MTFYFDNVYVDDTATVCGPYEKGGPLGNFFDKSYKNLYCGEKSFEKAEIKLIKDAIVMVLKKSGLRKDDIELIIGGDLLNQISASTYASGGLGKGFIGIYGACSTSVLGIIIASIMIQNKYVNNSLCFVSSHNLSSEKQFRYPTEYGAPRPNSSTFTVTGAGAIILDNTKSDVRVECATLGRIIDYEQNDPNDMGRVMSPSVIDTLSRHFKETGRDNNYYDLIVTGDLGKYGVDIVKDYFLKEYNISLKNYSDCGVMIYDLEHQRDVHAGGSGPACSALVAYSYLYDLLKKKKYKRILLLATGALFSPTMLYQKENINSICHAVSLEVV